MTVDIPSYLGSSCVHWSSGRGYRLYRVWSKPKSSLALGGAVACGVLYAFIGLVVIRTGTSIDEKLMPPIVTGAIVMIIGLHLEGRKKDRARARGRREVGR